MILSEYLSNKPQTPNTSKLIEKLKLYWDNDEEFIMGVLCNAKTEEEKQLVIDYIEQGEDVSFENIILFALDLKLSHKS